MSLRFIARILPALALGVVLVEGFWLYRFFKNNGDLEATNQEILNDIATARFYGGNAATLVEALLNLPVRIMRVDDFNRIVCDLALCRSRLDALDEDIRTHVDKDFRVTKLLEERMRLATLQYAILLASNEAGTATEQLSTLYMSLYLLGRLDKPLRGSEAQHIVGRLRFLHRIRKAPADRKIVRMLSASTAPTGEELSSQLSTLRFIKALKIDPTFIVHALWEGSLKDLKHSPIFDEMVKRFTVAEEKEAA